MTPITRTPPESSNGPIRIAEVLAAFSFAPLHHPQRVKTLTLIEPPAFWVLRGRGPLSQRLLDEERAMQTLASDGVDEERLVWFTHFAGFVPETVDPRTLPQWPVWFKHRHSLRIGGIPFLHEDSLDLVRAFEKPVFLVKGQGSNRPITKSLTCWPRNSPRLRLPCFPVGTHPIS